MTTAKPFDADNAFKRMRERTREAREHEAGQVFSAPNIDAVMSAAATAGKSAAVFAPTQPMDLSETEIAKGIVEILQRSGFSVEWVVLHRPNEETYKFLRVSWA